MSLTEKTKQCAGTVACRFRWVLRLAIVLLAVSIVTVWLMMPG